MLVELVRGRTIASIAECLVVSENTIKAHTKSVYRKIGVHTREELLQSVEEADGKSAQINILQSRRVTVNIVCAVWETL